MIDLHLHTTASDGESTPAGLVAEARAAGLSTIAVTDHDTTAAIGEVVRHAGGALDVIPGIEITAVESGRDVHVLGYFIDPASPELQAFLVRQRDVRRQRMVTMVERLRALGVPVPDETIMMAVDDRTRSVGRPLLARALVDAGRATDIADAFDKYLGTGRPAFVERSGLGAAEVVEVIVRAGGLASLAHPGTTRRDDLIPSLAGAGLAAIEVFHPDHDAAATDKYRTVARDHGLAMTGGSDYHGPGTPRSRFLGRVGLPAGDFARLVERLPARAPPVTAPLIVLHDVVKPYDGPAPLRVRRLEIGAGERLALGGVDAGAAETLVHLVTGAALAESGEVLIAGTNTRAIATDTAWLASLDRFGIVTDRAVLIEKIPVASNLALPLTLAIDPMSEETRRKVGAVAAEVELAADRLDIPVTSLTPPERLRLHLARAIAPDPQLLILEHPTVPLNDATESAAFGRILDRVSKARGLAVFALTTDDGFARASGAVRCRLDVTSGKLLRRRFWQRI